MGQSRHYSMLRVSNLLGRPKYGSSLEELVDQATKKAESDPAYAYLLREVKVPLHPVIAKAYEYCKDQDLPTNWVGTIRVEWPHKSEKHPGQIAYTRNTEKGNRDLQTPSGVGSYLKRVTQLPDPAIELLVHSARKEEASEYVFLKGPEIVSALNTCDSTGPTSCMVGPDTDFLGDKHPYLVYTPDLGWAMACRLEDTKLVARAIVNNHHFVRIYGPTKETQFSNPDDRLLLQWLEKQGYSKIASWEGYQIKLLSYDDRTPAPGGTIITPYVDGSVIRGEVVGDTIKITRSGNIPLNDTSGYQDLPRDYDDEEEDDHEGMVETEDGHWIDEDEACNVDGCIYSTEDCTYLDYIQEWALTGDCVETYDGETAHFNDVSRIQVGDHARSWAFTDECIEIDADEHYGETALKADCVTLPTDEIAWKGDCEYIEYNSEWALKSYCVQLYTGNPALREDCIELQDGRIVLKSQAKQRRDGSWYMPAYGGTPLFHEKEFQSSGVPYEHVSRMIKVSGILRESPARSAPKFCHFLNERKIRFNVSESGTTIYFTILGPRGARVKIRFGDHGIPAYKDPLLQKARKVDLSVDPDSGMTYDDALAFVLKFVV